MVSEGRTISRSESARASRIHPENISWPCCVREFYRDTSFSDATAFKAKFMGKLLERTQGQIFGMLRLALIQLRRTRSRLRHYRTGTGVSGLRSYDKAGQRVYAGTSSNVVVLRLGSLNPSTYLKFAVVVYFNANASSALSLSRALRTGTARTGTSCSSMRTCPSGCARNARYQPFGLSFQERTTTRPSTTTTQIGI
jgi:hypothetical protein